jgi:hypothetical protein
MVYRLAEGWFNTTVEAPDGKAPLLLLQEIKQLQCFFYLEKLCCTHQCLFHPSHFCPEVQPYRTKQQ